MYDTVAPKGYNLNYGGDSREVSDITRKKLSDSHDGTNPGYFKNGMIPWHKGKKMGKPSWNTGLITGKPSWNRGIPMTNETKIKISEALKGKSPTKGIPKPNARKRILCITNGIEYDSMSIAAKELSLDNGCVSKVCYGILKHTKGFKFKYL